MDKEASGTNESFQEAFCSRFVLFKKHYDKYVHLSQKYEEARNIAYYLEEKYHEVKVSQSGIISRSVYSYVFALCRRRGMISSNRETCSAKDWNPTKAY